jgi:hypothetical protein
MLLYSFLSLIRPQYEPPVPPVVIPEAFGGPGPIPVGGTVAEWLVFITRAIAAAELVSYGFTNPGFPGGRLGCQKDCKKGPLTLKGIRHIPMIHSVIWLLQPDHSCNLPVRGKGMGCRNWTLLLSG